MKLITLEPVSGTVLSGHFLISSQFLMSGIVILTPRQLAVTILDLY